MLFYAVKLKRKFVTATLYLGLQPSNPEEGSPWAGFISAFIESATAAGFPVAIREPVIEKINFPAIWRTIILMQDKPPF